jgi:tRNA threonylcarbamoyl adenosine modification protein YeaZ
MILAIDTSSSACSAALFGADGVCIAQREEVIGRGHAERLVPMIAQVLDGRRPTEILVGVGPGSFTGIRVAIAAAHGLSIGWNAKLSGMSSLALLAAGNEEDEVATAVAGGHGELFVQEFAEDLPSTLVNLPPQAAAAMAKANVVVGSGAKRLVDARGWGEAIEMLPSAANALRVALAFRDLAPKPIYARAPDARVPVAA